MQGLKGLEVVTKPVTPLITTADAKTFLRVDSDSEDALIALYVESVTTDIENYLRRALITQTLKLTLDDFAGYGRDELDVYGEGVHDKPFNSVFKSDFIQLARPPLQSVTSIVTYDSANSSATFSASSYTLDEPNGRVFLNDGNVWPTDLRDKNAIEVTYVAGYGDAASDVPAPIRRAAYSHLNDVYNDRGQCEDGVCMCDKVKQELSGYKLYDYLGFGNG